MAKLYQRSASTLVVVLDAHYHLGEIILRSDHIHDDPENPENFKSFHLNPHEARQLIDHLESAIQEMIDEVKL